MREPGEESAPPGAPEDRRVSELRRLQGVVDALRGPGGCPWDREQKLRDMARYLEEETAEVIDALEEGRGAPTAQVCEELGDLLMNVLLAAKIAQDEGKFDIADVAATITEKLVRRHPHVFGDVKVSGVEDVLRNWNAIKAAEKGPAPSGAEPPSRLDGVPRSLSPLEQAHEIGRKAAKVGFDWPSASGALEKVSEELEEVRRSLDSGSGVEAELGDLLFAVVNVCRKAEVRPGNALRGAIRKFRDRFRVVESRIPNLEAATLEEMESVWQEAKRGSE